MKIKLLKILLPVLIIIPFLFCFFLFWQKNNVLNIIHITDTHIENNKSRAFDAVEYSPLLLEDALNSINDINGVDIVLFGGDLINNKSKKNLNTFYDLIKILKYPYINAFGNHDFYGSNKDEMLKLTKRYNSNYKFDDTFYAFDIKNNRIIILDSTIKNSKTANGFIDSMQFKFFKKELENNKNKTVIIVLHHALYPPYEAKNHVLFNASELIKELEKYKNPIIILQGHYHATKITTKDNIIYVSTPAMVTYPMAFRNIKITNYKNKVKVDFSFYRTRLDDINNKNKLLHKDYKILEGELKDRNNKFIYDKKNKRFRVAK